MLGVDGRNVSSDGISIIYFFTHDDFNRFGSIYTMQVQQIFEKISGGKGRYNEDALHKYSAHKKKYFKTSMLRSNPALTTIDEREQGGFMVPLLLGAPLS